MRNFLHITSLLAAMLVWLAGIFLGFEQPIWGLAGTCCTLVLLAVAMKTDQASAFAHGGGTGSLTAETVAKNPGSGRVPNRLTARREIA